MKKQVLFIHGGEAYSEYEKFLTFLRTTPLNDPLNYERPVRWRQRLPETLGEEYEVYMPSMPNHHCSKYEEWKIWFERHFEFLRDGVILGGWSQGAMFHTRYLNEHTMPVTVKALYLISGAFEREDFNGEDGGDFYVESGDLTKLRETIKKIIIIHSEDDFVVPYKHAEKFMKALPEAETMIFKDRGHFLQEEFPELIEHIKSL